MLFMLCSPALKDITNTNKGVKRSDKEDQKPGKHNKAEKRNELKFIQDSYCVNPNRRVKIHEKDELVLPTNVYDGYTTCQSKQAVIISNNDGVLVLAESVSQFHLMYMYK